MNTKQSVKNRFVTRREAALRQVAGIGPFIEGTLVRVPRKDCRHVAHRLTFKVAGKTKTVYVPLDRVEEVERDPADWPDGYDYLDALSDVDGTDFSRAPAIRREITRLQRLIGMEEQVRPGQVILEMSQGRCRRLKAGEWHTVKAYYEF